MVLVSVCVLTFSRSTVHSITSRRHNTKNDFWLWLDLVNAGIFFSIWIYLVKRIMTPQVYHCAVEWICFSLIGNYFTKHPSAVLKQSNRIYIDCEMYLYKCINSFIFSLIYFAEKDAVAKWSFMDSFWWGLMVLTTVGYGARAPHTFAGQVAPSRLPIFFARNISNIQ